MKNSAQKTKQESRPKPDLKKRPKPKKASRLPKGKADKTIKAHKAAKKVRTVQVASQPIAPVEGIHIPGNKRILVIDIGGSNVKAMLADHPRIKIPSRPALTPRRLVSEILAHTQGWEFEAISIGFPAPVENGKIVAEPTNLGTGWLKSDWERAFGKPVKIINDAAMQALGSYAGGRMLFLGLGTGLGSALIHHGTLIPLELCESRFSKQLTLEEILGKRGYKRIGAVKWGQALKEIVGLLRRVFQVDYIVLGGGNAKKVAQLPEGTRTGHNNNAYVGGLRLWAQS